MSVQRKRRQTLGIYGLLLASFALASCVMITRPPDGFVSPTGTVEAEVGFRSQMCLGTFSATLDGRDVTQDFNPQPPAATLPKATFSGLTPRSHTVTVSAETLQYWFLFPYCGSGSDSVTFTVAAPPQPSLGFAPAGPLNVDAGGTVMASVTASSAPSNATTVNLASNSSRITLPASTTIAANQTSSAQLAIAGQVGGSASVTASAPGFQNGSITVNVRPVISSLSPSSGTPGTPVTVNGRGFASGASASFGGQAAATTFVSSSQLSTSVPNVGAGQHSVAVAVAGQTSPGVNFLVLAPPAPSTTLLFRTSANDVQTFGFSSGSFTLLDTDPATVQGGTAVVNVAFNGQNNVVRTSAVDVQSFNLIGNNSLTLAGGAAPGSSSGTGASIAAVDNLLVRASDVGLETYLLVNGVPHRQVQSPVAGTMSATGVAVDVLGTFAVRAHANGIDVYNVSNTAAPTLVGSAGTVGLGVSSVGVGVKFAPGGAIAVRSNPGGIDIYTIALNGMPTRASSFLTGALSAAINTAVAINATGTRAVRAHSTGIEVYDISNPASPQRIGQRSGAASTTGVGAFIVGTIAFRATNSAIEAYDISNVANIPPPVSIPGTISSVGVGLSGR